MSIRPFYSKMMLAGALGALSLFCVKPLQASTAPATVLSLDFVSGDPALHIGSVITVNMVVLQVSTQMTNVTNAAAAQPANTIDVYSQDLASVGPANVYVTDGTRTWKVAYGGVGTFVTIGNGNLINAGVAVPSWTVANYTSLQNQTFRMYVGTALPGGSGVVVTANLGNFGTVTLNDSGTSPDVASGDEVWSAAYTVPDLEAIITASRLYGRAYYNGAAATNDYFQSPGILNIDGLRPAINSVNFTVPTKPNYNNVLYLSANCQGTATPDPTNTQGRFDVTLNKNNTVVSIIVGTTPPKTLPAIIVPSGAQTLTGWAVWDGTTGNGLFAPDGVYSVNVNIQDGFGVQGTTQTSQVTLTSMRFEVSNIRLSPGGRNTQPTFLQGLITTVQADITAFRDGGGSLRPSLVALGWFDTMTPAGTAGPAVQNQFNSIYYEGGVYSLMDVGFLDGTGTQVFGDVAETQHDSNTGADYDQNFESQFTGDNLAAFSSLTYTGDGVLTNDWDPVVFRALAVSAGTALNPTNMVSHYGVSISGASPAQGNYRLRFRARLSGLGLEGVNQGLHFNPSIIPAGGSAPDWGQGIYAEDSSIIFQVSNVVSPISDNTPPVFITSNPADGSTVAPTVYGPPALQALSAQFQDPESDMNPAGAVSFITVTDPQGGSVPGTSSTDGGGPNNTLTMSFQPSVILNKGGIYTMTVNTCDNAGLCVAKPIKVTVLDQTAPSVASVSLVKEVGLDQVLSINQSSGAEGPFQGIKGVKVGLSIPSTSTNTIDWVRSNVSLVQILSNNTRVPVSMTRTTQGTPTDGILQYTLTTPIDTAGKYEVDTQTFSLDSSGNSFIGPPVGTIPPQFTTVACLTCVTVLYPGIPSDPNDPSRPAINAALPLTLTAASVVVDPLTVGVSEPFANALPTDTGWTQLTTAFQCSSLAFNLGGVPQAGAMTWTYPSTSPVTFHLYFLESDLPAGVLDSNLSVRSYLNGVWSTEASATLNNSGSGKSFDLSPASGLSAAVYYAIKYPAVAGGLNGVATATPYTFKSTRSFNPVNANPIYRKARFFYTTTPPKDVQVRIYDTAGTLVKSMALNAGVNAGDLLTDPSTLNGSYFFQWDGTNDNGDTVKNGLYLVRWQVTNQDDSSNTQVKPVALLR
jgi:flagellar hook assembly protein FlgD